jgi:hypothetical protein
MTAIGPARPQQAEHVPPRPIRRSNTGAAISAAVPARSAGNPAADVVLGVVQRLVGAERHAGPGLAGRDLDDVELLGASSWISARQCAT